MLVGLLGILDLFAAAMIFWPGLWLSILFILGVIYFIKGAMSLTGSLLGGFWFDWMGLTDLLVGISFIFMINVPFLWVPLFLKGLWSVVTGW